MNIKIKRYEIFIKWFHFGVIWRHIYFFQFTFCLALKRLGGHLTSFVVFLKLCFLIRGWNPDLWWLFNIILCYTFLENSIEIQGVFQKWWGFSSPILPIFTNFLDFLSITFAKNWIFLWVGFKLGKVTEPLQGDSLLLTTNYLEVTGIPLINLRRMKGWGHRPTVWTP